MARRALVALALLSVLAASALAQDDAEAKFLERARRVNEAVAATLVKLGSACLKDGLNVAARRHLEQALEHDPGNEKALRALGFREKKTPQGEQWELDAARAPPAKDAEGIKPAVRTRYRKERDDTYGAVARELCGLAETATREGLPEHAVAAYEAALRYNPLHEPALRGAGWTKDELGDWISPRETRERQATQQAQAATPDTEELAELPEWTSALGPREGDGAVAGLRAGNLSVLGTGGLLAGVLKQASAARALCLGLLGGDAAELRVVVTENAAQHKAYCEARHPGVPGMVDFLYVVAPAEVEVLRAEQDEVTFERVVFAVALWEVRHRCGEVAHPWFEAGFAGNLTRRLCSRVTLVQHSGEAAGPAETGRWKRTLKQLLAAEETPSLDKLVVTRDPDESQVIFAHFFVRWLCQDKPGALGAFCAAVKGGEPMPAAMKQAWLAEPVAMERAFLAWFASV